jgi:hypothetical protein
MEPRSIKQLLQVMLANQDLFKTGLCNWAVQLEIWSIISEKEEIFLKQYIWKNRPSKWLSVDAFKRRNDTYYWKYGDIKPRIKWIKKHIKKLS